MKKLFVSPHPDDVEIACGGTIARAVQEGHEVHVAVAVGEGDIKMRHSGITIPFSCRMAEQEQACKVLGVKSLHFLNLGPAAHLDEASVANGVTLLDTLLKEEDYDEMYFPQPSFNQDHQYVCTVCLAATRPPNCKMTLFMYEQPTQFHGEQMTATFNSRYYVSVSPENQALKEIALACHQSQVNGRQYSLTGLTGSRLLSQLRGLEIGMEFAEMFHLLRQAV